MVGSPAQGVNTLNGLFFDPVFNYGESAFMGYTEHIEAHLNNKEEHEIPQRPRCSRCGGSVMTPAYDFDDVEGYQVKWDGLHDSPLEYAVFGWARSHQPVSGSHVLFRMTINNDALLGDQQTLGDRTLMVTMDANHVIGSTFSYDIQG
jgi:hypothetical protein